MQPELPPDTNPPEPTSPKAGFFDKIKALFQKKVASPAEEPARPSQTPSPVLDENADRSIAPAASEQPATEAAPSSEQPTDNTTGLPQASEESAPDADGETTSPEVIVPDSLSTGAEAGNVSETPTVAAQPAQQPQPQTPGAAPTPEVPQTQPLAAPATPTPVAPQAPEAPAQQPGARPSPFGAPQSPASPPAQPLQPPMQNDQQ